MRFEEASRRALIIQEKLLLLPEFIGARRLALYAAQANEVHTELLLSRALEDRKEVSFPRVDSSIKGGGLVFFNVESRDELTPGLYGVPEPSASGVEADIMELDLIIVPGIAFDGTGARIGYGKGYYDKALKGVNCVKVALAYDMQVSGALIPVEEHDVSVDLIVTESRVMKI